MRLGYQSAHPDGDGNPLLLSRRDGGLRPNPDDDSFQDEPTVILEVLSESTRRIDEEEKKDAYLGIPSLELYVMLEQDAPVAVLFQRTARGFERTILSDMEALIPIPGAENPLPLAEMYQGVRFEA